MFLATCMNIWTAYAWTYWEHSLRQKRIAKLWLEKLSIFAKSPVLIPKPFHIFRRNFCPKKNPFSLWNVAREWNCFFPFEILQIQNDSTEWMHFFFFLSTFVSKWLCKEKSPLFVITFRRLMYHYLFFFFFRHSIAFSMRNIPSVLKLSKMERNFPTRTRTRLAVF